MDNSISVMVVDDTTTYRRIIVDAVNTVEFANAVATAPTGEIALKKLAQTTVDLVLLDLEMPGMGGLKALKEIRQCFPTVDVVIVSGTSERAALVTIRAMHAGAFEFLRKPDSEDHQRNLSQLQRELRNTMAAVRRRRQTGSWATRTAMARTDMSLPTLATNQQACGPVPTKFSILAVAASTGGPKALTTVVSSLPADFPLPVVIVQHMPATFTDAFATDLDGKSALSVREANQGDPIVPGQILIAPGGRHMIVEGTATDARVAIVDWPKENSCRPAADVLFRSVAEVYGAQGVLALIMTGMGSDGLKGVLALKQKGCHCITQSKASCVVYGMPQAVDVNGLSDESVDIAHIAERLTTLARTGAGVR